MDKMSIYWLVIMAVLIFSIRSLKLCCKKDIVTVKINKKIKNIFELNIKQQDTLNYSTKLAPSFSLGEVVTYKKTQEKFIIKRKITEDLFECSSLDTNTSYTLNRNELQK